MGKLRQKWDENNMKEAVEKVRTKEMTIREASERYSIPKSTLGDKVKSYAEGALCYDEECVVKSSGNCKQELFPDHYPKNIKEILAMCNDISDLGNCMIGIHETCKADENELKSVLKVVDFITTVCNEDNPIKEVISSNIECISSVGRKLEQRCDPHNFTAENYERGKKHMAQLSDNFEREEITDCFYPFWDISCQSIVVGLECGDEVKEAVAELLNGVSYHYVASCTERVMQDFQLLYETYESILVAEHSIINAIKKRK